MRNDVAATISTTKKFWIEILRRKVLLNLCLYVQVCLRTEIARNLRFTYWNRQQTRILKSIFEVESLQMVRWQAWSEKKKELEHTKKYKYFFSQTKFHPKTFDFNDNKSHFNHYHSNTERHTAKRDDVEKERERAKGRQEKCIHTLIVVRNIRIKENKINNHQVMNNSDGTKNWGSQSSQSNRLNV